MALRVHELKSQLRKASFEQRPSKGGRAIWAHPDLPGERLTISGNDDDLDGRCQEATIRKAISRLPGSNRQAAAKA